MSPNEAAADRELTHRERILLADKFFGLYLIGFAGSESERVDERCAMDNSLVPFMTSHLTKVQREHIEYFTGETLPVNHQEIDDEIKETRSSGYSSHCIPLRPCPLCGHEPDFVNSGFVWLAECPSCGLLLGLPYGYASRLDLCRDWNRRHG
jgi:hypothetical protein